MGSRSLMQRGNFGGKVMSGHVPRQSAMSCAKMAEPVEVPFGLWTRVSGRPKEARAW